MVTICATPIKAQTLRVTLLDICGVPIFGEESAQITSDSFTMVENSPNYEEGQRFLLRKANGAPCVNERDAGFLNWIQQTVTLCTLDPDLIAVVTGDDLVTDGDDNIGVIFGEGLLDSRFSLELWQPVVGEEACTPGGQQRYVYWAFPHMKDAQIQDHSFQNDTFTFGWQAITVKASTLWEIGDPWLADNPASTWSPDRHYAFAVTEVPPPEPACGAVEISS